ncbi:C40 family peptidase [Janibacter sp. GS2]|uniref:C40 family peptidase n=1 Tax=Janibacter sp. GS2 TaxID=3442646 RepID=UPI003EBAF657
MSMFYTARHSAARTSTSIAQRAGVGVLAATALGLGASTVGATSASANGGPETPAPTTQTTTQTDATQTGATQTGATQTGAQSVSGSTGSTSFSDVVTQGDTGSVVEQIQEEVGVSTDGTFGPQTEQAVTDWQGEQGLVADGVVGPNTGSKMGLSGGTTSGTVDSGSSASSSTISASTASTGSSTTSASTVSTSSSASTSGIVGAAEALIGSPYVMGGTSPSGFDCSGLVQHVYAQNGKDIPRTTQQQQAAATPVSNPQPGDIVFFGDSAYHNGIYAGDGKIIDAGNPGTGVTERDIWTDDVSYGRF